MAYEVIDCPNSKLDATRSSICLGRHHLLPPFLENSSLIMGHSLYISLPSPGSQPLSVIAFL